MEELPPLLYWTFIAVFVFASLLWIRMIWQLGQTIGSALSLTSEEKDKFAKLVVFVATLPYFLLAIAVLLLLAL